MFMDIVGALTHMIAVSATCMGMSMALRRAMNHRYFVSCVAAMGTNTEFS